MTSKHKLTLAAIAAGFALSAHAANILQTANNSVGTSGFNSTTGWNPAVAPSAGNDYFNQGFLLRTPPANGSYTFGGDSLTITGGANFGAAGNEALMWKGGNTTGNTITVNNLIVNGGQIRHGEGDTASFTLAGNITVGASGAGFATQGGMFVTAPISGTGDIVVMNNGNNSAARTVFFQSAASTFTGDLILNNAFSRATFNNGGVFNFALGGNGVTNSISNSGTLLLDGVFNINTSSADLSFGNSWVLVSGAGSTTYGGNFGVAGFSNMGGGIWSDGVLEFDTASGILEVTAVPEPSAFAALAGLGGLGFAALRRRRRA